MKALRKLIAAKSLTATRRSSSWPRDSISSGHEVVLSARVATEIATQLEYGLKHFGPDVAERTFARLDAFLFQFLPDYPYAGKYLEEHGIYETWIGKTPFVIFYRVDAQVDIITVLALFHHAQDRAAFDPED